MAEISDIRITLRFYKSLDPELWRYLQSFENGYVRNDALRRLLSKAVNTPGFIADVQLPTSVPEPVIKRSDSGFEVQTESVSVQKSSDGNLSAPNFEPADSIQAPSQGDSLSPVQSEPAGETDQAPSEPRSEPVPLNQPSSDQGKSDKGFGDEFADILG